MRYRSLKMLCALMLLILMWQLLVRVTQVPNYFVPTPKEVALVLWQQPAIFLHAAIVTLQEALLGLFLAVSGGFFAALIIFRFRIAHFLFWPILLISQALPSLALAPLLVLWFGYAMISKVILVMIVLFFPVTSALLDGLRRVPCSWLQLAALMTSNRTAILWQIQLPAALPYLAAGVRIAAASAMIAAVVGEWVGASQGLGFLLLEANARLQTDQVFAVLSLIVILSLLIYFGVHWIFSQCIRW